MTEPSCTDKLSILLTMGKRRRTSDAHAAHAAHTPHTPARLSDLFLLPELFLHVLSFLPPPDLARVQRVNQHWESVAGDPGLWRRLYLERFSHPHHTVYTPSRPRRIARLPSRAFPPPSPSPSPGPRSGVDSADELEHNAARFDGVDWKAMLRLGTNWSNGNVLAEASVPVPPSPPTPALTATEPSESPAVSTQHLALFPSFIARASGAPLVHVYTPSGALLGLVPPPPGWSSPSRPDNVTCVVADSAVVPSEAGYVPARLGVFYASGGFAVVRLRRQGEQLHWARESVYATRTPPRRRTVTDPVVLAAMHDKLLVTCTASFKLSIYLTAAEPVLLRSLTSDVSFHPASLSLHPADAGYRAALTFSTPVYPRSWSVAVQELDISLPASTASSTPGAISLAAGALVHRRECHHVQTHDLSWPRRIRTIHAVRSPVAAASDGRWCVLAGEGSVLHVFSLPEDTEGKKRQDPTTGIVHAHTLLAPPGGVGALALAGGRCVSGGERVLVWELDGSAAEEGEARLGVPRSSYVEVRAGGRRSDSDTGDARTEDAATRPDEVEEFVLPHPRSIASAARTLFLASPPTSLPPAPTAPGGERWQLAFDEEKIVGVVSGAMRIWSFR